MANALEKSTIRRLYRRLIPLLFIMLIVNYLDRVNIGFAALQMNKELGFSSSVFGFGAGIFFIGYAIFEVPSNMMLHRFGARVWLSRIMITWGIVSGGLGLVHSETSFYILRFLLGIAEAGFIPGVVLYLTYWFPVRYRSRANAGVIMATAIASAVGSPLSVILMQMLNGLFSTSGWRWMLFLEAAPAVILGVFAFFWLTDKPEKAKWLRVEERAWLCEQLDKETAGLSSTENLPFKEILKMPRVWILSAIFVCFLTSFYGVLLWLPQIVKSVGGISDIGVGFISALPFVCAAISMYLVAKSSDNLSERRLHIVGCMVVGGLSLLASAIVVDPTLSLLFICIAASGIWGCLAVFWTLTGEFLTGGAAAIGIALINTIGQCGGLIGPWVVGIARDLNGNFFGGMILLAIAALFAAFIALTLPKNRSALSV